MAIISLVDLTDAEHKIESLLVGVFRRDIFYMIRTGVILKRLKAMNNADCRVT